MYEAQSESEWEYILGDCEAHVVLVANEKIAKSIASIRAKAPKLQSIVVMKGDASDDWTDLESVLDKGREQPVSVQPVTAADVAGLIYTSGTTGKPKGVLLTHENFASNVSAIHQVFPIKTTDRSLSFLPWAHSFGQTVELHALFSMGASLGIAEAVDKILGNLGEVRPTLLFSVPRIFNKIYDGVQRKVNEDGGVKKWLFGAMMSVASEKRALRERGESSLRVDLQHRVLDRWVASKVRARFGGRLQYAFSGGAAITKEVAEFIDNLGILVYEGYGLSETSPIITANWRGSRRIGSVGRPIPGCKVVISDEDEVIAYGPNVMKGYHNLDTETKAVLQEDGGFRTGDMGRLDDDGFLYITGRTKEQYKLENGKYVAPSPLEEQIKLCPFFANVMIYGANRKYNVAVVVPDFTMLLPWAEDHGISNREPRVLVDDQQVRSLFDEQMKTYTSGFKHFERVKKFAVVPEDFTVENGMLTPTLKVKRRVVLERYQDTIDALYAA